MLIPLAIFVAGIGVGAIVLFCVCMAIKASHRARLRTPICEAWPSHWQALVGYGAAVHCLRHGCEDCESQEAMEAQVAAFQPEHCNAFHSWIKQDGASQTWQMERYILDHKVTWCKVREWLCEEQLECLIPPSATCSDRARFRAQLERNLEHLRSRIVWTWDGPPKPVKRCFTGRIRNA